jgi:hypothetical protein
MTNNTMIEDADAVYNVALSELRARRGSRISARFCSQVVMLRVESEFVYGECHMSGKDSSKRWW